jgi:hypothetical protein
MTRYKPRHVERAYQRDQEEAMRKKSAAKVPPHPLVEALIRDRFAYMLDAYQAGQLDEDVFLPRVRDTLFGPFDYVAERWGGKYKRLSGRDVVHKRDCYRNDLHVRYSSRPVAAPFGDPDGPQPDKAALTQLSELAQIPGRAFNAWVGDDASCVFTVHVHTAECPCGAVAKMLSAHVQITWAGRTLAREYHLPHQEPKTP